MKKETVSRRDRGSPPVCRRRKIRYRVSLPSTQSPNVFFPPKKKKPFPPNSSSGNSDSPWREESADVARVSSEADGRRKDGPPCSCSAAAGCALACLESRAPFASLRCRALVSLRAPATRRVFSRSRDGAAQVAAPTHCICVSCLDSSHSSLWSLRFGNDGESRRDSSTRGPRRSPSHPLESPDTSLHPLSNTTTAFTPYRILVVGRRWLRWCRDVSAPPWCRSTSKRQATICDSRWCLDWLRLVSGAL